jgi:hypothetical protein
MGRKKQEKEPSGGRDEGVEYDKRTCNHKEAYIVGRRNDETPIMFCPVCPRAPKRKGRILPK